MNNAKKSIYTFSTDSLKISTIIITSHSFYVHINLYDTKLTKKKTEAKFSLRSCSVARRGIEPLFPG